MDVMTTIAVASNNTQCVNLDAQDTHMHVKEMKIQLVETYVKPFFSLLAWLKCVTEGPCCFLRVELVHHSTLDNQ